MAKAVVLLLLLSLFCYSVRARGQLCLGNDLLKKLPNIDFLGAGYDVFRGDPRSRSQDPGFKTKKVLALNYKTQKSSADGNWVLPDNVDFLPILTSSFNAATNEVFENFLAFIFNEIA